MSVQGIGLSSGHGDAAERIEAEADVARPSGASPRALTRVASKPAASFDWTAEIEIDGDAGIEIDIVERAR